MKLEPVIGLEIHVQLKTVSKMFCSCANVVDAQPRSEAAASTTGGTEANSAICPICMGYPGTLPVPNKTAIEWTLKTGAALNCELNTHSKFDRKSYFYPDLPKGYQISQYDQPFCGKGELEVMVGSSPRKIGITRIHLEEDAAKNIHPVRDRSQSDRWSFQGQVSNGAQARNSDYTLIDFNRAGTPLMEIVTEPDIRTPEEAKIFLQELQRIMRALDVSDADMEKGQLRCDANISLREAGSTKLHPKTEVKNLNSFRNVERALQFEIKRQTAEWEKGEIPSTLSTRGFNADRGTTYEQRTKEEAADYRYFPEPDIPPFEFTAAELKKIADTVPELPHLKRRRLVTQNNLSEQQAHVLVDDPLLADFFEATASELAQLDKEQSEITEADIPALTTLAVNMITRQLRALITEQELGTADLKISPENFAELVVLVHQSKVNKNAISQILDEMQATGGDPDPIIAKLGLEQVSGTDELEAIIDEVIAENPDVIEKIKAGKTSALQFLVGKVMAKTRGKARPDAVRELLQSKLGS